MTHESPTANLTRLDLARAQLRDESLTPGERRAAWGIVFSSVPDCGLLDDAAFSCEEE